MSKDEDMERRLIAYGKAIDAKFRIVNHVMVFSSANIGLLIYYLGGSLNSLFSELFWLLALAFSVVAILYAFWLNVLVSDLAIDYGTGEEIKEGRPAKIDRGHQVEIVIFISSLTFTGITFLSIRYVDFFACLYEYAKQLVN